MVKNSTTPRGLHTHAVAFSAAAEVVHMKKLSDPLPKYFLWGRTIELVLKSFLLSEGTSIKELKSRTFGHDLTALLRAAKTEGIGPLVGLNATHTGIVRVLNFDYLSKRFEYRETGATYHLPNVILTRQLVKRLIKGVDFHLQNKYGI